MGINQVLFRSNVLQEPNLTLTATEQTPQLEKGKEIKSAATAVHTRIDV